MKDKEKTKEQLLNELIGMRGRIAELENPQPQKQSKLPDELRRFAEERVKATLAMPSEMQVEDASRLVHELRVHQIELELQNEELRNALRQLEESHARYSDLYEFAPVGYLTLDKNGLILKANLTASQQLGLDRNSLINSPFQLYISMSDRDRFGLHLNKVFKARERQTCEVRMIPKSGGELYALFDSIFLQDADGKELCRTSVIDITERKRAEQIMQESEERFRTLVEGAPDAIFIRTQGQFAYVNGAATRLFGATSAEELLGKTFIDRVHPDYRAAVQERIRLLVREKEAVQILEQKYLRLDGTAVDVEVSALPFRHKNHDGALVFVRDITARRRAEEARLKLEAQLAQVKKTEAVATLAGGIAHYLNNILMIIIGNGELAMLSMSQETETRVKGNIRKMLEAADRAKDLVKQIISFSRMKGEQKRKPVDISPIIKETLRFLRASLPATIEIRQTISSMYPLILADSTQIHQVLTNLCTNAAHAMEERGGVLKVSLTDENFDSHSILPHPNLKPGDYVRLTVSDEGHGMDSATMSRIFDPYFTTKEMGKGSGLGLAVIQEIVDRHEGAISIHSEVGKGSTFHVYFPRRESKEGAESLDKPLPKGTERILFVEDEAELAHLGQEALRLLGYEVLAKISATEALETFRAQPWRFDLVITDYSMPQMTGESLAKEMMRIRPDIPIILCTGFTERITEDKAMAIGIRAFLMKPLNVRDLAEAVRKALDKK